jgi:hypothetical protein
MLAMFVVQRVLQELQVVLQVLRVRKGQLGLKDSPVPQDLQDHKVRLDLKVLRELISMRMK